MFQYNIVRLFSSSSLIFSYLLLLYLLCSNLLPIMPLIDPVLPDNIPRTDPLGWRLLVSQDSHGQHKWVYLPPSDTRRETWPQSPVDKYWLGLETVSYRNESGRPALEWKLIGVGRERKRCQRLGRWKRPRRMGSSFTSRSNPKTGTGQAPTAVRPSLPTHLHS